MNPVWKMRSRIEPLLKSKGVVCPLTATALLVPAAARPTASLPPLLRTVLPATVSVPVAVTPGASVPPVAIVTGPATVPVPPSVAVLLTATEP